MTLDLVRVGAIVLGAERPSAWRPADPHLASIVTAVVHVARRDGTAVVDVGEVADVLRAIDPTAAWPTILGQAMHAYDAALDRAAPMIAMALARRAEDELHAALARREAAQRDAEHAYDLLTRALDLAEAECRRRAREAA